MQPELSDETPDEIMKGIENLDEAIQSTMSQVHAKEKECLQSIFTRFCLNKGKMVDFSKVNDITNGNKTAYWYCFGTDQQYFLMDAEFKVTEGIPNLIVNFNHELAFNNEL